MYLIITDIRIKIQGLNNDGQQCDEYQLNDTNKTDRHDIAEILLKMALNTMNQTIILSFLSGNLTLTFSSGI